LFLSLVVTSSLRAGEAYVPFRLADGNSGPARLLGFKLTADATEILPTVSKITNETLVVLESLDPDKKPIVPRPFLFSEFAETTQRLIRSRNTTRLLAETRKAKLARLKNKSASHAAESLIRSYETFVKEGNEPATIKESEFKQVLERSFRQLQTSDQREPLVQYLYALIRSQLDARGTSHRQLEALVRNYPLYWNARRALVYSVTNEESYISGAKELKKFHDELTRTLHAGNHSKEELKALLDEYFWVVDTAAVFEMKPKTKKLADAILEDPRSQQMIADAEDRLQTALADQKQRAEAKAAEEEKRISSLVGRAKPLFDTADKEYRRKWDATLPLYQQAMTNYQLAEFRFQETYVRYRQTVANYEQISSRLRNARDKRTNASEDDRKLLDNEVDRLAREQTAASSQAAFAERTAGQANLFRMNAFQQMRGMSMQLQGIMVAARAFLFAFSREYFEAIEHDPELQGKYKILENTVAGMRQQLFALALKKQAKTKASDLLKEESRQVVGLLQFSPHRAILDLKEELKEGSAR
ncbi:MAG: hypothetical protein OSB47_11980, partial [Pirellulaceae bacterium]|nr:hypothetical protein [Pirellulaceae bacterium]